MSMKPGPGEPDEVPLYPKEYIDKVEQETTTMKEIHAELNKVLHNLRENEAKHPLKLDINMLTPEQKAFLLKAPDPHRFLDITKDYLAHIQIKQQYEAFVLNIYKKQCKAKGITTQP